MRQNDKIKTSTFSEYQNNENDSISSRQLQFWLKQTAPVVQPKFAGIEWTLMSTNSIFEQDEHTLLRNQTFQSLNKQNDQMAFNSARPSLNNTSSLMKSKSYVNAMVDLQNKVKKLEQQNQDLQTVINKMRQQKNLTLSESTLITQQLKNRLQILEPKTKKLEDLIKENKKLRDLKEQNAKKYKMLQKINKENVAKLLNYQQQKQKVDAQAIQVDKQMESLKRRCSQYQNILDKNKEQLQRLQQKNKTLEGMKEKSTTSIIEKYNKSVQMMQSLTTDNEKLKSQIYQLKEKSDQKIRLLQQKYRKQKQSFATNNQRLKRQIDENNRKQKQSLTLENQRLKQQLTQKKQYISKLINQSSYFRQNYQKKNQQLIKMLQVQATQRRQINESQSINNTSLKKPSFIKIDNKAKQSKQELDINRESIIKIQEEQINNQIESQLQLDQINSNQDQLQNEQILKHQTRSVGKQKHKNSLVKSVTAKPIDSFSHENMINNQYVEPKSSTKRKSTLQIYKSCQKSQQKPNQKSKSKQKSRSKSREVDRYHNNQNQHSFILKSCEPITQQMGDHLMYSKQPFYFNSANTNPTRENIPYYWEPKEIPQFATSQKGSVSNNNNKQCNIHSALLMEASKQAIRLIEEQQKCMNFLSQNMSQNERAEYNGRMKQINKQISLNYEKMFELKSQIAQANNN